MKKIFSLLMFALLLALFVAPVSLDSAKADTAVSYSTHATIGTVSTGGVIVEARVNAGYDDAIVSWRCGSTFLTATAVEYLYAATATTEPRDYSKVKITGVTNYGMACPSGQTLYLHVGSGLASNGSVNVIKRP